MSRFVSIEESRFLPTQCPVCGENLVWEGVDLKCNNPNCANIKLSDLQQWCECIGQVDGLQWTLMSQCLSNFNVFSVDDLYNSDNYKSVMTYFQTRKLSITEQKLYLFFKKLYSDPVDIVDALKGLNIPRLGDKTAELLATNQVVIEQLLVLSINAHQGKFEINQTIQDSLMDLVKSATTMSLLNNLDKYYNLHYLYSFDYKQTRLVFRQKESLNLQYVAVTGALHSRRRKDFEKYISNYNYKLSSSLKQCKFLITNEQDSTSSKYEQAQKYNIPIITEKQFIEMLNSN